MLFMDVEKQNYSLKTVIIVMSIILFGCFIYIFRFADDTKVLVTSVKKVTSEKDIVSKRLEKLKKSYEEAINKKTAMSEELIKERDKVLKLLTDLKNSNGDPAVLASINKQSSTLENNNKKLIAQNDAAFVSENNTDKIRLIVDSVVVIKNQAIKSKEILSTQIKSLEEKVVIASKLSIVNLSVKTYKFKDSEKETETEKASKAEQIKCKFTVQENILSPSGKKTFFVQIIDPKNNVIGEKKNVYFAEKTLTYSFATKIDYVNKVIDVSEILMVNNLEEGNYFVNVFFEGELLSKTTFKLN